MSIALVIIAIIGGAGFAWALIERRRGIASPPPLVLEQPLRLIPPRNFVRVQYWDEHERKIQSEATLPAQARRPTLYRQSGSLMSGDRQPFIGRKYPNERRRIL